MTKTRQWAVLTAVVVLVVLAGGWFLLVSGQRSKAKDLDAQASQAQSQVATLDSQLAELQSEKKNLPAQQRVLAQITTRIPNTPAEPTLIRQLQAASSTAGVDLSSLSPATPIQVTATTTDTGTSTAPGGAAPSTLPLWQIPVTMTVLGTYFNLEMFEHEVEKLPRAMVVSGLSIVPGDSGPAGTTTGSSTTLTAETAGSDPILTASLTAAVFLSPSDASTSSSTTPSTTN